MLSIDDNTTPEVSTTVSATIEVPTIPQYMSDEDVIWHYNGQHCEADASDLAFMKRFKAAQAYMGDPANAYKGSEVEEAIIQACNLFKRAFDIMFGEGMGDALCGAEANSRKAARAMTDLIRFVTAQSEHYAATTLAIAEHGMNRQQRRAASRTKQG